jgi:hypothetical protein
LGRHGGRHDEAAGAERPGDGRGLRADVAAHPGVDLLEHQAGARRDASRRRPLRDGAAAAASRCRVSVFTATTVAAPTMPRASSRASGSSAAATLRPRAAKGAALSSAPVRSSAMIAISRPIEAAPFRVIHPGVYNLRQESA